MRSTVSDVWLDCRDAVACENCDPEVQPPDEVSGANESVTNEIDIE